MSATVHGLPHPPPPRPCRDTLRGEAERRGRSMRGVVPEPLRVEDPREIAGYPLYARIGEGGMGTVYLSRSRGGQPVALKLVRPEYADSPAFRERFAREV